MRNMQMKKNIKKNQKRKFGFWQLFILITLILPQSGQAEKPAGPRAKKNVALAQAQAQSNWRVIASYQTDAELLAIENKKKFPEHLQQQLVLQRVVSMGGHDIPMGTVTQYLFRRENAKALSAGEAMREAKRIAEELRNIVKGPAWEVEKTSSSIHFVADWPKVNRFVRLVYKNLGTHYAFSIASSRRAFFVPVLIEAMLVQDRLVDKYQTHSAFFSLPHLPVLDLFSFPEAQAVDQLPTSWTTYLNEIKGAEGKFGGSAGIGDNARADVNGFVNSVAGKDFKLGVNGNVNVNVGLGANVDPTLKRNIANPVNGLANSISGAGQAGSAAANNLASSMRYAADQGVNMAKITAAGMNDAANKVVKNAPLVALVGYAGLIATQGALHFITDGTIVVAQNLYHLVMGTLTDKEKDEMTQRYGQAFREFDKSAKEMNDIEQSLDENFLALAVAANGDPEGLIKKFQAEGQVNFLDDLDMQRLQANSNFRNSEKVLDEIAMKQGVQCADYQTASKNTVAYDNQVRGLEYLYKVIAKVGGDYSLFCHNMQNLFDRWVHAEYSFYLAKKTMQDNYQVALNNISAPLVAADQKNGSLRKNDNFCNEKLKAITQLRQKLTEPDPNCVASEINFLRQDPSYSADFNKVAKQYCMQLSQESIIKNTNEMSEACGSIKASQAQAQNSTFLTTATAMAAANVAIAKDFFEQLNHEDCRIGVHTTQQVNGQTKDLCDGKSDGDFTGLQKRYEEKLAQSKRYCPNLTSNRQNPADNNKPVSIEQVRAKLASPRVQGASESGVKPETQCNIFCRIFRKLSGASKS